jgi:RNA polymerase sigma-70 factor (ECF subfamily)
MTQLHEEQLAEAAAAGDPGALEQLLEAYQHRVYNVCLRMLSHRDDAAEAAQDVMVRVIEKIRTFRGGSSIATWIIRIAMNQSISMLRKRKVRRTVSLDGQAAPGGGDDDQASHLRRNLADSRELDPARDVENEEMLVHLREALAKLDEQFRCVLVLRDLELLDYQQIGQVLDLPVGTVKSRLFRARLALRHELVKLRPPAPSAGRGQVS